MKYLGEYVAEKGGYKTCWNCKSYELHSKNTKQCKKCKSEYNKRKDPLDKYTPLWASRKKSGDRRNPYAAEMTAMKREVARRNRNLAPGESKWVVDHIIPRNGAVPGADGYAFTGMHVPWNLQIIREDENVGKNNYLSASELDKLALAFI